MYRGDIIFKVVFQDVLYLFPLYISGNVSTVLFASHDEYLLNLSDSLRYLSFEHICVSGTVKQMQIHRYYCASVSRRRAKHIKYLIPDWDTDRQHDDRVLINTSSVCMYFSQGSEFFPEKEMKKSNFGKLQLIIDYLRISVMLRAICTHWKTQYSRKYTIGMVDT